MTTCKCCALVAHCTCFCIFFCCRIVCKWIAGRIRSSISHGCEICLHFHVWQRGSLFLSSANLPMHSNPACKRNTQAAVDGLRFWEEEFWGQILMMMWVTNMISALLCHQMSSLISDCLCAGAEQHQAVRAESLHHGQLRGVDP